MARAREDRVVAGVVAEDVPQEVDVLHLVPAVLRVERAARRALAGRREEVPLEEHVLHRGRRVADAPAALERAVLHRAVDGQPEGRGREAGLVRRLRALVLDRHAEERRALRDPHLAVLPRRLGREEPLLRVVPRDRHLPGARGAALVAEELRDLQAAAALLENRLEVLVVRREAVFVRRVDLARPRVEPARRERGEPLEEEREPALVVLGDAVLAAVARDLGDLHALDGAVPRVAGQEEARRPLGVVRRARVVVLPVVALQGAADEMRVRRAREAHQRRARAREAVLLEDGLAEVERQAARHLDGVRPGEAVRPRQHHEPAEARCRLLVDEILEPQCRLHGVRLDRRLVVPFVVDDLRLLEGLPGQLAGLGIQRHRDDVARHVLALLLHDRRRAVRRHVDDPLEVAVVADAVGREVRLGHPVDLVRGNLEVGGIHHAEVVDDAVRLAPLRVDRPDAQLVLARGELAEVELGVAARKVRERQRLRRAALRTVLEKRREAVRVVEEADLRGLEVRHEEADLHGVARRDGRLHVVGRDVRVPQRLGRLVAAVLGHLVLEDRGIREIPGQDRGGAGELRGGDGGEEECSFHAFHSTIRLLAGQRYESVVRRSAMDAFILPSGGGVILRPFPRRRNPPIGGGVAFEANCGKVWEMTPGP